MKDYRVRNSSRLRPEKSTAFQEGRAREARPYIVSSIERMTEAAPIPKGLIASAGVLDRIVAAKIRRLVAAKDACPFESIREAFRDPARESLSRSLNRQGSINVIAEIKRRSPSKGVIREVFEPADIAKAYAGSGAAAISVLTEEDFFDGSLSHLCAAREAAAHTPILRKDFVFDEYQVYEAAVAGADAVLLIAAILDDELLERLIKVASEIGLDQLVEVHDAVEMRRAAAAGARIIGVNNRDLRTFQVTLETSERLAPLAPSGAVLVSESGVDSGKDIVRLRQAGFNAFLVGERLMRASDPGAALHDLIAEAAEAW